MAKTAPGGPGAMMDSRKNLALDYNKARAQFPALLIARLFGFTPAALLRATKNAQGRQSPRQ